MHMKHDHSHDHNHDHSHDHNHGRADENGHLKNLALLSYMLEHNRQHAEELHDTGHKLQGLDAGAAELIHEAVGYFNRGNEKLREALERLKEET